MSGLPFFVFMKIWKYKNIIILKLFGKVIYYQYLCT